MYLENKEQVLSIVRDVLDGKKTTKDVLSEFGLIGSFDEKKQMKEFIYYKKRCNFIKIYINSRKIFLSF